MNTKSNKRWNGQIETLSKDYLNDIIAKMTDYGDRIQFRLNGPGMRPHYQVTNTAGKKMAFDSNNHLIHSAQDEFIVSNISGVFTLASIKACLAGGSRAATARSVGVGSGTRSSGNSRGSPSATKAKDLVDIEKYEYFKKNRTTLPPKIGEHSEQVTQLMRNGMSAEDAFGHIIKQHF